MYGEYAHTIDTKGRMFLPSKFRSTLGDRVYLVRGIDNCVCIYPVEEFDKFIAKLDAAPHTETKARNVKRALCASAVDTDVDAQGRVLIPSKLRSMAGLEKSVIVVGMGDKAEIWNPERYEACMAKMDAAEIEAELIGLGL
ncbi:MAG: division/cell wall cluster transcriptional repressor MraZ [Clostridia bacterium]|nr:division/cell wall cluster transcriptional repressor MraZ [Clostridia bacterium]MBQ8400089.1 division/cell wall cluster transcriptional repressor MraZ [Clostridia bacterium]